MPEFRDLTRKKQQLPPEECAEILRSTVRGVLSVNGDGGFPYGMPMNHWYAPDGRLYFHGGKSGHKIDALRRDAKASFCVMDNGTPAADGWWLIFRSVIVFGHIELIEDREQIIAVSRALSHQFTQDESYIDEELRKSLSGTLCFALVPEHICGKRVTER